MGDKQHLTIDKRITLQDKKLPLDQDPASMEQIKAYLVSVSQTAEAALELGINVMGAQREILEKLNLMDEKLGQHHAITRDLRKETQALGVEVQRLAEISRFVPTIKSMLSDILARLPE